MGVPPPLTRDNFVVQFQTNYLSHSLLTYHLLPLLEAASSSPPGQVRIVNVTSDGDEGLKIKEGIRFSDPKLESESAMTRYGHSKLGNILHTKQLHALHGLGARGGA